jgi:hypothetical protein
MDFPSNRALNMGSENGGHKAQAAKSLAAKSPAGMSFHAASG